jgi:multidrug efflux pump subunit AcrB
MGSGPAEIARYDRKRYVSLTADLSGAALGAAVDAVKTLPSVRALPSSAWVPTPAFASRWRLR